MSDTPRTDAISDCGDPPTMLDLARELERENADLRKQNKLLAKAYVTERDELLQAELRGADMARREVMSMIENIIVDITSSANFPISQYYRGCKAEVEGLKIVIKSRLGQKPTEQP